MHLKINTIFLLLDSIYFILIYTLLDKHCQRMIKYVREWQSMEQYGSARQVLPETGSNRCNAIQSYSIRVRLRVIISVRVLELEHQSQIQSIRFQTQGYYQSYSIRVKVLELEHQTQSYYQSQSCKYQKKKVLRGIGRSISQPWTCTPKWGTWGTWGTQFVCTPFWCTYNTTLLLRLQYNNTTLLW